ncbi:MAG TPA: TonB-dependent receptor [Cyclobacteriaceae bacterium]|nr:TonB-dependent receptor [Cyclobacteriaceae bacterium]
MERVFTLFLTIAIMATASDAQTVDRLISGQLKSSEDGSPLPGVNIRIKGTEIGTVSDMNGYYSLRVPIGMVVSFSFIGLSTQEYQVTESGLVSCKNGQALVRKRSRPAPWPATILTDSTGQLTEGVAFMSNDTPPYRSYLVPLNPQRILDIQLKGGPSAWFRHDQKPSYFIKTSDGQPLQHGFHGQASYYLAIETGGKMPALQSAYAQGSNSNGMAIWKGPETGEAMSWGPLIKTLEFDGSAYPYDRSGRLVTAGQGNGSPATSYNPTKLLRTAFSQGSQLMVITPGPLKSKLSADVMHRSQQGIVYGTKSTDNLFARIAKMQINQFTNMDVIALYSHGEGTLLNRGGNLTNVMGAILKTPTTFDNTNGYSSSLATNEPTAYQLDAGNLRSSAPGINDNPYGLIAGLPDNEKSKRTVGAVGISRSKDNLLLSLNISGDRQRSDIVHGIPVGYSGFVSGRCTDREEEKSQYRAAATVQWKSGDPYHDNRHEFGMNYQGMVRHHQVDRRDAFGFAGGVYGKDSIKHFGYALDRIVHEARFYYVFHNKFLDLDVSNAGYFSSTVSAQSYINLFPALTISSPLGDALDLYPLYYLTPFFSVTRTIRETPGIVSPGGVLSTRLTPAQYASYYEDREITWNGSIEPETEIKMEIGVKTRIEGLLFDMEYFRYQTSNFILPVWRGRDITLENAANVINSGVNASVQWLPYNEVLSTLMVGFQHYDRRVASMLTPGEMVPLAGFSAIQTVAKAGDVLGAIYGTTYLRNSQGKIIIGTDGFPLIDPTLRKIGNPLPAYIITIAPTINVINNRVRMYAQFEFKHGGDIWNGTRAALNYLGRSAESAAQRNIANYVFDGVTAQGHINTTPVSFYDPRLPLSQNRWVREGFGGVGESYIEDGSWFRLSQLSVSYKPATRNYRRESVTLTFIANNVFLITPYSGVDPAMALFGYQMGTGLDLFNLPSLRTYSLQCTFKF